MRIAIPALNCRRYRATWRQQMRQDQPPAQSPADHEKLRQLFAQDLKASIAKPRQRPKMKED